MSLGRTVLKLNEDTLNRLRDNAKKAGKSLVEYIVDRSIIFEDYLLPDMPLQTSFISQKSFERDIYRVDVDASNFKYGKYLLVRRYEVWFSLEAIEDKLRLNREPALPELAKFAFDVIKAEFEKYKDRNGDRELPKVYGYLVTSKGMRPTKTREDFWVYLEEIEAKLDRIVQ